MWKLIPPIWSRLLRATRGINKKIIHEEEEHEALKKELSPDSKKNRAFMFISIILIILALAALVFFNFS